VLLEVRETAMTTNRKRCCFVFALMACVLAGATAQAQKAGAVDAVRPQATIQSSAAELPAAKGVDVSWNDSLQHRRAGSRPGDAARPVADLVGSEEVHVVQQAAASSQSSLELDYGSHAARETAGAALRTVQAMAVAGVFGTNFGADASVPGTTDFICLEGEVRISKADPKIPGTVVCKGGYATDVKAGQPPAEPTPTTAEHMENCRRNNEPESDKDATDHPDHH
jgi:hypothetical protein